MWKLGLGSLVWGVGFCVLAILFMLAILMNIEKQEEKQSSYRESQGWKKK